MFQKRSAVATMTEHGFLEWYAQKSVHSLNCYLRTVAVILCAHRIKVVTLSLFFHASRFWGFVFCLLGCFVLKNKTNIPET